MDKKRVLVIGLVWPEPSSSAAGKRIIQLMDFFVSSGYEVIFASAASKSEFSFNLQSIAVEEQEIKLNDASFNLLLKEIEPSIVLFDRFMIEEQYGWRVQEVCPNALKILDTEDLHCLRHARQKATKAVKSLEDSDLYNDLAKREIAAILRCDVSLMISEAEIDILQEQFRIDPSLLLYIPFLEETISERESQKWKSFEEREGFTFIGNYLHEPNWHTLQFLKTRIWPQLKKKIPGAGLHIYGAYSGPKVLQLNNEKEQFYVHGRAEDAKEVISKHRILIAPIKFGAGLKGKFIDAMQVGTPSVTSTIGAEGIKGDLAWNGAIEDDDSEFIKHATQLYLNKNRWLQSQQNGIHIINERFGKSRFYESFSEKIESLRLHLRAHRQHNFIGQILQHHTANSTKYMSLWIEEKNKTSQPKKDQ